MAEEKLTPKTPDEDTTPSVKITVPEKKFTQAELEEIIKRRLEKYTDYEDLQEKAKMLDKIEEEKLSELEKLQKRIADLEREADTLRASKLATEHESAVIRVASRLNFADPQDVIHFVDPNKTDEKEIEAELLKLAEQKSYLLKSDSTDQKRAPKLKSSSPPADTTKEVPNETYEQKRARIYGFGRDKDVFDPEAVAQRGGGVVYAPGAKEKIVTDTKLTPSPGEKE